MNGVAFVEDAPAYVTCLGAHRHRRWLAREQSQRRLLLDVATGEMIARGLSMPHSPRYHDGKLWLLESGLAASPPSISKRENDGRRRAARLHPRPRFPRTLAFIGLSQVRETAVFSGIAICEPAARASAASGSSTRAPARPSPSCASRERAGNLRRAGAARPLAGAAQ